VPQKHLNIALGKSWKRLPGCAGSRTGLFWVWK